MTSNLTLITGGAASGKSAFAERLVRTNGGQKHYLATAQAFDDEMREKVKKHQNMRGQDWITYEEPFNPALIIANLGANDILLLDCATLWLTNLLLGNRDISAATSTLLAAISDSSASIVVVTNEVGSGIVPQDALSRKFRQAQGELNQQLSAKASTVAVVISGLPMVLKGQLPDKLA